MSDFEIVTTTSIDVNSLVFAWKKGSEDSQLSAHFDEVFSKENYDHSSTSMCIPNLPCPANQSCVPYIPCGCVGHCFCPGGQ
ncbi:MAG: hypothetical protein AB2689_08765 [Candidatus Thiodiazotropha taylori]